MRSLGLVGVSGVDYQLTGVQYTPSDKKDDSRAVSGHDKGRGDTQDSRCEGQLREDDGGFDPAI